MADFENAPGPEFPKLLELVDHLIITQAFAEKLTGLQEPAKAAAALWHANRDTVAITAGSNGCWYLGKASPGSMRHRPAFKVDALDTTGCGDVFHGAYALALAEQRSLDDRIAFASAAAALKATRRGGQSTIPTRSRVDAFMKS